MRERGGGGREGGPERPKCGKIEGEESSVAKTLDILFGAEITFNIPLPSYRFISRKDSSRPFFPRTSRRARLNATFFNHSSTSRFAELCGVFNEEFELSRLLVFCSEGEIFDFDLPRGYLYVYVFVQRLRM